jgi:hypothetical protein
MGVAAERLSWRLVEHEVLGLAGIAGEVVGFALLVPRRAGRLLRHDLARLA